MSAVAIRAPARGARDWAPLALGALALLGGALIAVPSPLQAASLLVAVVVVPVALRCPVLALCLAILAIPLSSEWSTTIAGLNLTLMEPAVGLAVAAWLWQTARERSLRLWPSALLVGLCLVLVLFLVSALGSESRGPSLKDTIKWLELLLVFVLTVDQARRPDAARWLILALVGAAALEACYGAFQFATGRGPFYFAIGPFMRAHGHFGQPNPFAGYLGTALPLALAMAVLLGSDRLLRWTRPATVLLAGGIVLSLSRGAWLGILAALAVMLAVASQRSRRWLVVLGAALCAVTVISSLGILPAAITDRINVVGQFFGPFDVRQVEVTPENWSLVERMAHWQAAWYMFLDYPWLGLGPGNYAAAYDRYFLPGWVEALGHAHNYYLNLAAEVGLVGLAAYLLALGLAFRAAVRGLRGPDPFWRAVAFGVLGSLVAISLHSAFDNLFVHGVSVQVGALLGLAQIASDQVAA